METIDLRIQDTVPKANARDYVILQSGKGKSRWSKIYISAIGFSYLEGMIWDKFREYRQSKKTKISSSEWIRIIEGFKDAKNQLHSTNTLEDLQAILKFGLMRPVTPLSELMEHKTEYATLLQEVTEWISSAIKQEKYILILKNM